MFFRASQVPRALMQADECECGTWYTVMPPDQVEQQAQSYARITPASVKFGCLRRRSPAGMGT